MGGSRLAFCLRTHSSNFFIMSLTSNWSARSGRGGVGDERDGRKCFQSIESEKKARKKKEKKLRRDEKPRHDTMKYFAVPLSLPSSQPSTGIL